MFDSDRTHEQNVRERIERDGPVAEILRQADMEWLKPRIEAFYEHGSGADASGLRRAFESLERREFKECDLHRARLIEEILSLTAARQLPHDERTTKTLKVCESR
jgi:hypothetical protein